MFRKLGLNFDIVIKSINSMKLKKLFRAKIEPMYQVINYEEISGMIVTDKN